VPAHHAIAVENTSGELGPADVDRQRMHRRVGT